MKKKFHDLTAAECAALTREEIEWYATEEAEAIGEEFIREQVLDCQNIVAVAACIDKPSSVPKLEAQKILFKKIFEAMITADTCLSDGEVLVTAARTVEHYRRQYCAQPVQKAGT